MCFDKTYTRSRLYLDFAGVLFVPDLFATQVQHGVDASSSLQESTCQPMISDCNLWGIRNP